MRVAYLVLAHNKPQQLLRLIGRLVGTGPVFLHFDKRAKAEDWAVVSAELESRSQVALVPRHRCYWGSYGIVAGTMELVRSLVESNVRYDYAMLLSGSDYPIKSAEHVRKWLIDRAGQEHIESFPIDAANRWSNDVGKFASPRRYRRFHIRIRSRVLALHRRDSGPCGFRIYGGSQWWCLSRECINYVHRYIVENPSYCSFFRHTLIPDEAFFQTIVSNSPFSAAASGSDLTFAVWNRPTPPWPAFLTEDDLPRVLESDKLFGRKFDLETDGRVLDALDKLHS